MPQLSVSVKLDFRRLPSLPFRLQCSLWMDCFLFWLDSRDGLTGNRGSTILRYIKNGWKTTKWKKSKERQQFISYEKLVCMTNRPQEYRKQWQYCMSYWVMGNGLQLVQNHAKFKWQHSIQRHIVLSYVAYSYWTEKIVAVSIIVMVRL